MHLKERHYVIRQCYMFLLHIYSMFYYIYIQCYSSFITYTEDPFDCKMSIVQ